MAKRKAIHFSLYPRAGSKRLHGGVSRSAQLAEYLLNRYPGLDYVEVSPESLRRFFSTAGVKPKLLNTLAELFNRPFKSIKKSAAIAALEMFIGQLSDVEVVLIEMGPGVWGDLSGCKVEPSTRKILAPHNVEALVPSKRLGKENFRKKLILLSRELASLRRADEVVTISHEESWLLSLLGCNTFYLPYALPREKQTFCQAVRALRGSRHGAFKDVICLGSYGNYPTRLGTETLISSLPGIWAQRPPLVVCGYGAEQLKIQECAQALVRIRANLNESELVEQLVSAKALLIHQIPTSGSLTRLLESRACGIPVIVNHSSASDYRNDDGVYVYDDFSEIPSLIDSIG